MHEAGYMHGDLKPDNVLFEDFDADGCPKGIQLADFGLSHELGKPHIKFPKQYYNISWHEAGTVFNGVKDPFKLTTKVEVNGKYKMHYVVDSRLDECSFAMLMYELFNERVPSIQEHLGKGACGPMGPERGLMMPWVPARGNVAMRKAEPAEISWVRRLPTDTILAPCSVCWLQTVYPKTSWTSLAMFGSRDDLRMGSTEEIA